MFFNPTPIGGGSERVGATFGGMRPPRARPPIVRGGPVMSFKRGGKVKRTGLALVHKNEIVIPAPSKKTSISQTMGGSKKKSKDIVRRVGKELKQNPPRVLAKTAKKSGAKQAEKQRVAILLSKSRKAGAKV